MLLDRIQRVNHAGSQLGQIRTRSNFPENIHTSKDAGPSSHQPDAA